MRPKSRKSHIVLWPQQIYDQIPVDLRADLRADLLADLRAEFRPIYGPNSGRFTELGQKRENKENFETITFFVLRHALFQGIFFLYVKLCVIKLLFFTQ